MLSKSDVLLVIQQMPNEFSLEQLVDTITYKGKEDKMEQQIAPSKKIYASSWDVLLESLTLFSDDFMIQRNQPPQQIRSSF